jgi:hypothetical protein
MLEILENKAHQWFNLMSDSLHYNNTESTENDIFRSKITDSNGKYRLRFLE